MNDDELQAKILAYGEKCLADAKQRNTNILIDSLNDDIPQPDGTIARRITDHLACPDGNIREETSVAIMRPGSKRFTMHERECYKRAKKTGHKVVIDAWPVANEDEVGVVIACPNGTSRVTYRKKTKEDSEMDTWPWHSAHQNERIAEAKRSAQIVLVDKYEEESPDGTYSVEISTYPDGEFVKSRVLVK